MSNGITEVKGYHVYQDVPGRELVSQECSDHKVGTKHHQVAQMFHIVLDESRQGVGIMMLVMVRVQSLEDGWNVEPPMEQIVQGFSTQVMCQ
jgi:capsid protein